jgi:hypothetical protein
MMLIWLFVERFWLLPLPLCPLTNCRSVADDLAFVLSIFRPCCDVADAMSGELMNGLDISMGP